jgi:hypothetical protein
MPAPKDGVTLNTITRNGKTQRYLRISSGPQRDKYVHQLVAEAKLGRALLPHEEVDHDDGDTLNNHWENLVVRSKVEHGRKTRRQAKDRREGVERRAEEETYEAYREESAGYTPELEEAE